MVQTPEPEAAEALHMDEMMILPDFRICLMAEEKALLALWLFVCI